MRLWHQLLISRLPRQQLLGQHRECCALRGKGWGRNHSTVNYVFTHCQEWLIAYHYLIMDEMEKRGYHPDEIWNNPNWRGTALGEQPDWANEYVVLEIYSDAQQGDIIYSEHNYAYYQECIENLRGKGIELE